MECGGWGRLHWRLTLLLALPVLMTGMSGTNYVFLASDTAYRCHIPECEEMPTAVNASLPPWYSWALVDKCTRRPSLDGRCTNSSFSKHESVKCAQFAYERPESLVAQFELGCEEWRRTMVGTAHNLGMFISLPAMGYVSDRWGRRAALVISALGAGIGGSAKSWATGIWQYASAELLEAAFGAGVYPAAFVLLIEWLSAERRILASLALGVPLAVGGSMLAWLMPLLAGQWRLAARLAYAPAALLLAYPWLLLDSARWLAARGRHEEAADTVRRAAHWNGTPPQTVAPTIVADVKLLPGASEETEENLWSAVFSQAELRRRLCICGAWWASAVFVLYGLAVHAASLFGPSPDTFLLLAAAEVPALALNTLLLERTGRRLLLRAACVLTGIACMLVPFVPPSVRWSGVALLVAGKLGASMAINVLYVYSAELFPTSARLRLLTLCSALGRLASILAPLTPLLASWIPSVLFSVLPLMSAALTVLMPDTLGTELPRKLADLDRKVSST